MVVYKYPIPIQDNFTLELPYGSTILTIQVQREQPCIWVLVDENEKFTETRIIQIVGTGHKNEDLGEYIGTFQMQGGALVFHAFELV